MELYIDTADTAEIAKFNHLLPLDGVTTNPSIVAKTGKPLKQLIKEISGIIEPDKTLFAQVIQTDLHGMIKEAKTISGLYPDIYAKIPVTLEGLAAIKLLTAQGIKTIGTAVFTTQQAILAAKAGASYVAPYVNRLVKNGGDGAQLIAEIAELFALHDLPTKILAASFASSEQALNMLLAGAHSLTLPPAIMEQFGQHPLTFASVKQFEQDWQTAFGRLEI
ncbi:MAG TPA: fructose-6-phosphate aldolase [Candidatus Wirthbacteria bacterium]|nr:fructose-6-phosphate aldolase [Candidatus Wirthbacteria bacterium]